MFITGAYCGCYIARSFREHLFVQAFLAVMLLQTMPRTREVADTGARPLLLSFCVSRVPRRRVGACFVLRPPYARPDFF